MPTSDKLVDEQTIQELVDFVPLLAESTYTNAEIAIELRDGEMYEVGGNWRERRERIVKGEGPPKSMTEGLIGPWMQWIHNMGNNHE